MRIIQCLPVKIINGAALLKEGTHPASKIANLEREA